MHHSTTGIAKYRSVIGNDYRVHAYAVSLAVICVREPLPFSQHCILLRGSDFKIPWWGTSIMHAFSCLLSATALPEGVDDED